MIYTIYVISSTGYPFYSKKIEEIPKSVDLHLRFMDYSNTDNPTDHFAQGFELFAGLISALSEFSRLLGQDLELLKFRAHKRREDVDENGIRHIGNPYSPVDVPEDADALINCQNERWLNPVAIEAKANLLFNKIVKKKLPLGPDKIIDGDEEEFLIDILSDKRAKDWLKPVKNELELTISLLIEKYGSYGLDGIVITSFDYSIIDVYNLEHEMVVDLLRNIGRFAGSFQYNVYIVNSGTGISVGNVFMPYYYLLICEPESFLGEIPQKIYEKINEVIDYE